MAGTLLDLADLATIEGPARPGDSLAQEALAIYRRTAGERHLAVAAAMGRVLSIQGTAGELAKAESTGRAAAAMLRELGLERHPQMVPILSDLAIILANRGEFTEALAIGAADGVARLLAVRHLAPLPRHPSGEPRLRL